MGFSDITIIIVFFMSMVGFTLGVVFGYILRGKQKPGNNHKDPNKKGGMIDIASILRDPATGNLVVAADNKLLSQLADIDPEKADNVEEALRELFGPGGRGARKDFGITEDASSKNRHNPQMVKNPVPIVKKEGDPLLLDQDKNQNGSKKEKPVSAPSIVSQINDVLQNLLINSDHQNRGIRLSEDMDKGVIVWVGLDHFCGIDAVPDPEVKRLIKEAVAEWEISVKPGR